MELHLTFEQAIAILQVFGIPILGVIWFMIKKTHRGNKLNGFKIEALVHAMQFELKNGFSDSYQNKLKDLMREANFVEDK